MKSDAVNFTVEFQDPLDAPPAYYCNHVAIARAGTEVQFEFVYIDLNRLAHAIEEKDRHPEGIKLTGRTVAKCVVPLHVFLQLEGHVTQMFEALRAEYLNAPSRLVPEAEAS